MALDPITGLEDLAKTFIDKFIPDADAKIKAETQLAAMRESGELQSILGQIGTNTEEAKSSFLWVAGWRPYIGWISGTGIGYQFVLRPLLNGLVHLFGYSGDYFLALEIQDLIALVTTMLGHSALRSWDKKNGTENGA